jgi:hypothetical protein
MKRSMEMLHVDSGTVQAAPVRSTVVNLCAPRGTTSIQFHTPMRNIAAHECAYFHSASTGTMPSQPPHKARAQVKKRKQTYLFEVPPLRTDAHQGLLGPRQLLLGHGLCVVLLLQHLVGQ